MLYLIFLTVNLFIVTLNMQEMVSLVFMTQVDFFQIKTVTSVSVILLKLTSSYSGHTFLSPRLQKVVLLIKSFENKNL